MEYFIKLLTVLKCQSHTPMYIYVHAHTQSEKTKPDWKKLKQCNKMQHVNLYWILVHKKDINDILGRTGTFEYRLDTRRYLEIIFNFLRKNSGIRVM